MLDEILRDVKEMALHCGAIHLKYFCSDDVNIIVRDFIAGMSDRYAVSLFEELFVPKSWNI